MRRKTGLGFLRATTVAAGMMAAAILTPAAAGGSYKGGPVESAGRQLEFSANIGVTSDYVFRGMSQRQENPAVQGGFDLAYGIFYAGVWASMVDFGNGPGSANAEVDFYGGIKPKLGPVEFDLGVIYYSYPGANDPGAELNFVEFKLGASTTVSKFSFGGTVYYSPEYTGEVGASWTLEGTAAYELPSFHGFTPSISGTVGTIMFDDNASAGPDYTYWNAGISLAVDKLTLDFRYWDTDLPASGSPIFNADERFVASVKIDLN
jgi:uncharacterized protein (TIGR02001 family)